jgi:hypothetical protein
MLATLRKNPLHVAAIVLCAYPMYSVAMQKEVASPKVSDEKPQHSDKGDEKKS